MRPRLSDFACLDRWSEFDAFALDHSSQGNALVELGLFYFDKVSFPCPVDRSAFSAFLFDLQRAYNDIPYHSRVHAADVAQACMWLIKEDRKLWESSGVLLLAALAHDCGHFARTNAFLRATNHAIVKKHGNVSPLEHHNLELSTSLMHKHKLFPIAILEEIEPQLKRLILATDPLSEIVTTDILALVIRASDVSALARNFERGLHWGRQLREEFTDQRAEEEKLGIPSCVELSDPKESSHRFAHDVVLPLFTALARNIPKVQLVIDHLVKQL